MADGYERFFREADTDGDGHLTMSELTSGLRQQGYKGSDQKIKGFFRAVDTSGDNAISFEEYMTAMKKLPAAFHRDAVLRRVFRSFDKDGNGEIDCGELKEIFSKLGKQLSDRQAREIMDMVDTDKSGTIDYEEFIASLDTIKKEKEKSKDLEKRK